MGGTSGDDSSRDAAGRGASWVHEHLGPGWVEVEPGIYEFLLNEVRTQTGRRSAVSVEREQRSEEDRAEKD